MAKYIIDIPDDRVCDYVGSTHLLIPYSIAGHKRHHVTELDITPYTELDQEAIEDEVWKFGRGLLNYTDDDWETIINMLLLDIPYQEAKTKYEAWRKQKDEIRVGDEVYDHTISGTGVVTNVENKNMVGIMWDDGSVNDSVSVEDLRKTGRHFDEVEDLLKKIKEK